MQERSKKMRISNAEVFTRCQQTPEYISLEDLRGAMHEANLLIETQSKVLPHV